MDMVKLEKSELDNVLGLSCIENYLLAALRKELPEFEWLYYQSYLPFSTIFSEVIEKYKPYAYFDAIPRIHQTAGKNHIIQFDWLKSSFNVADSGYCCIRVKPDYLVSRYGRKTWRDDHYFLIHVKDGLYYFLNDNPRDAGEISEEELAKAYDNEVIYFKVIQSITARQKQNWQYSFFRQIAEEQNPDIDLDVISQTDLIQIRDFIGILRILRKRTERFINQITPLNMQDYINELDNAYAQIEYLRLKNRVDIETIRKLLIKFHRADLENTQTIMKRMHEI